MGSLVGQTEQNIRQALRIADAMAPCILFLDEVEKALSGVTNAGDSGVSARLFGTFLTWLNDHESNVFVIATCNDISKLPPEFSRAERFDGVFFLDLPGPQQKRAIWDLYLDMFSLDRDQERPDDRDWTGAEIRSCCRLAALLDLPLTAAAQNVVPVAVTAAESVGRLRDWASGRCLNADAPGIYVRQGGNSRQTSPTSQTPRSFQQLTALTTASAHEISTGMNRTNPAAMAVLGGLVSAGTRHVLPFPLPRSSPDNGEHFVFDRVSPKADFRRALAESEIRTKPAEGRTAHLSVTRPTRQQLCSRSRTVLGYTKDVWLHLTAGAQ